MNLNVNQINDGLLKEENFIIKLCNIINILKFHIIKYSNSSQRLLDSRILKPKIYMKMTANESTFYEYNNSCQLLYWLKNILMLINLL